MASAAGFDPEDAAEAAIAGAERVESFLKALSQEEQEQERLNDLAHEAISFFAKFVSFLGKPEHARVRRGPTLPLHTHHANLFLASTELAQVSSVHETPPSDHGFSEPPLCQQAQGGEGSSTTTTSSTITTGGGASSAILESSQQNEPQAFHFAMGSQLQFGFLNSGLSLKNSVGYSSHLSKSILPCLTTENSMLNGQQFPISLVPSYKEQVPFTLARQKHNLQSEDTRVKCGENKSTCPRRRKSRNRRIIKVHAISSKIADIPPDGYSWRKYGQKTIKGLSYPRGYYKCSVVKNCPAKKLVDRCLDDPSMLTVTYEEEHVHSAATTITMHSESVSTH